MDNARSNIKNYMKKFLPEREANICIALTIGEKEQLDHSVKESFSDAGLSHIIAISGMHTIYVATIALWGSKWMGKRKSYGVCILILCMFCSLAHSSESVFRATCMLALFYLSKILYRKSDSITNLCIATVIALFFNPFCIFNTGFLMSSVGTLGIITMNNMSIKYEVKGKLKKYILEQIKMGACANVLLTPIIAKNYNKVSLMFLITSPIINYLVGLLMPALLIFMTVCMFGNIIPEPILQLIGFLVKILTALLIWFAELYQKISFLNFSVITPSFITIAIYYTIVVFLYKLITEKNKKRVYAKAISIIVCVYLCVCIVAQIIFVSQKNFVLYMVDVGQGDCIVCETPSKKKIMIDGGGNENGEDTVGEKIVVPFLRSKAITKLDFIIISHFDTDHVGGVLTVMEELKVDRVLIPVQSKDSDNYKKFMNTVNKKKIKVCTVKKGDTIKVDRDVKIDVLWPDNSNLIKENELNNNSVVCKICYKNFSCLFTGDVEAIAEEQIVENNKLNLKATVLKVAHHGSKTSSTVPFIDAVKPKVALIGVGKDNKFGHPNDITIENLNKLNVQIYRTDTMGQITIIVDDKSQYRIKKYV